MALNHLHLIGGSGAQVYFQFPTNYKVDGI